MTRRALRVGLAAAAAVAMLIAMPVAPASSDTRPDKPPTLPGLAQPEARAKALSLRPPTRKPVPGNNACAEDVQAPQNRSCFGNISEVAAFIHGIPEIVQLRPDPKTLDDEITTLGYGGTQANTSSGYVLGTACSNLSCSPVSTTTTFYASVTSYNYCTHAYPNNDYYKNYTVPYVQYFVGNGAVYLNCGTTAFYRNGTQGGAGAVKVDDFNGFVDFTGATYESISWHNG